MIKRAWLIAFLMSLVAVALAFADNLAELEKSKNPALIVGLAYLVYMAVCGFYGNRWLLKTWERKGFLRVEKLPDQFKA